MYRTITAILFAAAALIYGCADDTPHSALANQKGKIDISKLTRTTTVPISQAGKVEPAVLFWGPMPTGVAVSRSGRIFVNFPRWGDPVEFTVAEIRNGKALPYPNLDMNKLETTEQTSHLISVQSVVIDPQDRLWILDTGSINFGPTKPGGPKLLCVDLKQDRIVKRIDFPAEVAYKSTYLNDVRFDLNRGKEGMAFITDSSDSGPNGIIVVDLGSGTSWRKLNDDPSTKADPNFVPSVEGEPLMARAPGKPEAFLKMGSDGIAIDAKKGVLYYCPLASRRIYSVSLDALADPKMPDDQVAKTVKELPQRDFASDGLEADRNGTLFLTDYEHNAVRRLTSDGKYELVASDPAMIWPDSMSISDDGYLFFTANQLNRQPRFHNNQDLRRQPYVLFRTHVNTQPVTAMR